MMDEAGVDRVVVVPPSWPGDRNDYALEAARRYPNRFAVMGRIALEKPESAALLPKWKEQPGMLGIRLTFQREQVTMLQHADWIFPAAEKANVPLMFFAPDNLPLFAPIAEKHPGVTLIIDHMGMTAEIAKEDRIKPAIDEVVKLAKYPNVSVKVSSAVNFTKEPYPFRDMTDHVKRCFDAYGPQRCYWGTDLTNSLAKATYHQRIEHFTKELSFLSEEDKDWVMGKAILKRLNWA
jgi:predicted TIM-barrel fold metal-dependent hydrolase